MNEMNKLKWMNDRHELKWNELTEWSKWIDWMIEMNWMNDRNELKQKSASICYENHEFCIRAKWRKVKYSTGMCMGIM